MTAFNYDRLFSGGHDCFEAKLTRFHPLHRKAAAILGSAAEILSALRR
jgi:hypothetical protein